MLWPEQEIWLQSTVVIKERIKKTMPGAPAKCPNCGSEDVAYVEKSDLGGGYIHKCLDCEKLFIIDRIAMTRPEYKTVDFTPNPWT